MHVLVLGGAGYSGSMVTQALLNRGDRVTVFDTFWFGDWLEEHPHLTKAVGDIRDPETIPRSDYDACVHLANIANDPGVELSPVLSWEVNVLGSQLIADWVARASIPHLIYVSSGSVYGVKEEPAVTEDLSLVPISAYNKTKMVAERVFMSYQRSFRTHIVRPATICGVSLRMRFDLTVNMLTLDAAKKGVIRVFGGDQIRPNIHVHDIVRVYLHLLDNPQIGASVLNAGFENLSIRQIAEKITSFLSAEIVVEESTDPRSYRLDSSQLLATGFSPERTIEDAIRELVEYLENHTDFGRSEWRTVEKLKQLGLSEKLNG